VEIYPSSDSDRFVIALADNGIGFPHDLDFEQVESSLALQFVNPAITGYNMYSKK